jgi:GH24 family phage-related lysozyme (muramidase)
MANMRIIGSVGIDGKNTINDVKAVQTALNQLLKLISPTRKLVVDGFLGSRPEKSKTVTAIKLFQQKVVGMIRPDGKIDPNGKSHRKINEKLKTLTVVAAPLSAALKVTLKNKLENYEGRVENMYLDTRGNVTVGVGHLLSTADDAKQLAFKVAKTQLAATEKQIIDEFNTIKALPYGKKYIASWYKRSATLQLPDSAMDEITNQHISSFEGELKRIYGATEFSAYPKNVKLALFDMIFNLGMTSLKNTFLNFNKHIKANDYAKAAMECSRTGIQDERNVYVRNLLRTAND